MIMTGIQKYIEEMKQKYGDSIIIKMRTCDKKILEQIPQPLKEFYYIYDSIRFPFGDIYSPKINDNDDSFISEGWFKFGFDGYFSYWLCSYEEDEDGLWITPWDHEVHDVIEGVYSTLVEFLQDIEDEYQEYHEADD